MPVRALGEQAVLRRQPQAGFFSIGGKGGGSASTASGPLDVLAAGEGLESRDFHRVVKIFVENERKGQLLG